ncbi:MAG: glutamate ABC transporter substrate-binding protein [Acidimicrobiales bacterium]
MSPVLPTQTRPMRRRELGLLVGALLGLVLHACGSDYAAPATLEMPSAVTVAAPPAVTTRPCNGQTDRPPAVASYPPDPLPPPGQMPAGSYMAEIQRRGTLIVGTSIDTKLFAAINPETNKIEGFDIDMARLVAAAIFGPKDLDQRLDLQGITYAQRIPKVRSGEVDLVAHTMTINCARWQQVAFSSVYLWAGQKLLVEKGSDLETKLETQTVKTMDALAGRRVCVSAGGTSADEMASVDVSPPIEVVEVSNQTDCVVLFQQGEVDAIRSDDTVLAGFAAQDPFATVAKGLFLTEEPYGLAMSLDHPEFTSFVNAVIDQAKADGTWSAIYDDWLREPLGDPAKVIVANQSSVIGVPEPDYSRPRPAGT